MLKHWLSQPAVRALLAGVLIIGAASALKLYVDQDVVDPAEQRAEIDAHLLDLHKALNNHLDEFKDREGSISNLPTHLPWLPATLVCAGEPTTPSVEDAKAWQLLGWPLVTQESPRAYAYQITMRRKESDITWIARRDADCDGIYEVHTLKGSLGWGDTFKSTHVETQHLEE